MRVREVVDVYHYGLHLMWLTMAHGNHVQGTGGGAVQQG